ncbi:MAG TPA: isoprenylcysteine carboxylmethyltransferase family protein [Burkholderiaceae bacterium]|nr:isoprenylcysteine carboxylmethyltransferase family protein [Burkholderiaceae bacterium]
MLALYRYLFPVMWLGWMGYWWLAARNVKTTSRHESLRSRLSHIVPLTLSAILLALPRSPVPALGEHFLPPGYWPFWAGAVLTLVGLLFTVQARVHLGRNWSGTVTIKQDHELITSGPYRFVRHPIYTGLLLAFIGTALARAEWRGVLAVALAFWAFWRKLHIEERWMREQFGVAYEDYAQRVAALVPHIL